MKTQLERAEQLEKEIHDNEISYWESSISYDEMVDKNIALLLKHFGEINGRAYPDTEADGCVFCGKCGKMI